MRLANNILESNFYAVLLRDGPRGQLGGIKKLLAKGENGKFWASDFGIKGSEMVGLAYLSVIKETGVTKEVEIELSYWDFDAPDIPNAYRDASAGAIMASAFIELAGYTKDRALSKACMKMAEKQIRTLASDEYLAKPGENCNFILKHSVGSLPSGSEVDVPLTYADYYYLEALLRYLGKL
jgi:hypothetical protein